MIERLAITAITIASACVSAHEADLRLTDLGLPFKPKDVEIVWSVATNRLPSAMRVYNVLPARFSIQAISNLVLLGNFAEPQKVRNTLVPALKGQDCLFEEEAAHKAISISPQRGTISYFNTGVMALPGQPVSEVPKAEDLVRLSLEVANKLGINSSEFAKRDDSGAYLLWRDERVQGQKVNGRVVKRETARGIYLYRAVDGVSFDGTGLCGGLYVNFGNDAMIARIDLSWRRLELKKTCGLADRDEIIRRITTGQTVIQMEDADAVQVRKLTITDVVPHYRGLGSTEIQKTVYPFVTIQATAELENGKKAPASIACPIIRS